MAATSRGSAPSGWRVGHFAKQNGRRLPLLLLFFAIIHFQLSTLSWAKPGVIGMFYFYIMINKVT
jgi:hypothetical protein